MEMKLLVEVKDKYTDITDIINKSILDEGTKKWYCSYWIRTTCRVC